MHSSIVRERAPGNAGDSQRSSTTGNHSQRGQRDIGGLAELKEPAFIDMALVRMCKDELDAINLCIDLSRLSDEAMCRELGVDKGHWSRIRKGRAHFPTAKRIALMWLAGNWVPLQYEMHRTPVIQRMREQWEQEQQQRQAAQVAAPDQRWYA